MSSGEFSTEGCWFVLISIFVLRNPASAGFTQNVFIAYFSVRFATYKRMQYVVPRVLSQELILQSALILRPEQGELLSHPTGPTAAAWDVVGG